MKKRKNGAACLHAAAWIAASAGLFLTLVVAWLFHTWNHLRMDELMYHLGAPLTGTSMDMVWGFVRACVVPFVLILAVLAGVWLVRLKKSRHAGRTAAALAMAAVTMLSVDARVVWNQLDVGRYLQSQSGDSTFIQDWYVDAGSTNITFPEKKRNLIYIFLESMEMTYADTASGGAFAESCIPELTALAQENEDFSGDTDALNGGVVLPGTTWTMGGMFAQSSGLPLLLSMGNNNMGKMDSFFPTIQTLGDVLADNGYRNELLLGSDAAFGARDMYYIQHGDYDIRDYPYALETGRIPAGYSVFWGYEDQKLFQFAREDLQELAAGDQPFNLTLLTVDTHFEDGYRCPLCGNDYGGDQYSNVMACSSRQVAEFVAWVQQQDFYENTTIIINGDHLTMDNNFCDDVPADYQRRTYTCVINSACEPVSGERRSFSTLDMYPTTLAALGATIEGDRLGLGTNLFSAQPTLLERFGYDYLSEQLWQKSEFMDTLACVNYSDADLVNTENSYTITADISLEEGDGTLTVRAENLRRTSDYVERVTVTVYRAEDGSGQQVYVAERSKSDTNDVIWTAQIDWDDFDRQPGSYRICVQGVVGTGNAYDIQAQTYTYDGS